MRRSLLVLLLALLAGARLAGQTVYSIDGTAGPPTDEETLYVEFINRARADPAAEGVRLSTTTDAGVVTAMNSFSTNTTLLAQEFAAISARPPVAFNARLLNAARGHSQDQFNNQFQGHTGTNGSQPANRVTTAGYSFSTVSENVFSFASSVFFGHAGFEIDWGPGDGTGMQPGRGHRVNIHSASVREVGVGVVLGTNGSVGPQVVTQNFGTQLSGATALLTGVTYYDLTGDNFYSVGEGLGGFFVTVNGANFSAVTSPSGAFTVPLPGNGTYAVRFVGRGIDETKNVTVTGNSNVKTDLKLTFAVPGVMGPAAVPATVASGFTFTEVPGSTRYERASYRRDTATPAETAENATNVTLATTAGYNAVQTAVRSQGSAAFNLRVLSGSNDQTITLNRTFFGRPGASLTFASRLALASPDESAHVQVSTDAGATWSDIYAQTGTDTSGEGSFVNRTASLAALNGKLFRVRLLYAFSSGSFFTSGGALGWYVDDLRLPNCEELMADPAADLALSTSFSFTPPTAGSYLLHTTAYNGVHRLGTSEFRLITASNSTAPSISQQPSGSAPAGITGFSLSAVSPAAGATFQWRLNGGDISGAIASNLSVPTGQGTDTGIYDVVVTSAGGSTTSEPTMVGRVMPPPFKVIGLGTEIASDILHPNGNTFDQILLEGAGASFKADAGQITRLSYVDLTNDIVQLEFTGAGTVSILLDGPSGPAAPVNYNQGTLYMKGHAGIVVTGADETTNLSVFSVGRGNAVNQALFKPEVTYDGFADIAFIAIQSRNGKFGGLRTANTSYFATKGITGVYAPGVTFQGPVFVGDINASGTATPMFVVGSAAVTQINGGDLQQANGRAVQVRGLGQLQFVLGSTSHHTTADPHLLPAQTNKARLEQDGADITAQVVVNP